MISNVHAMKFSFCVSQITFSCHLILLHAQTVKIWYDPIENFWVIMTKNVYKVGMILQL